MSDYIVATTHVDLEKRQLIFDNEGYYVVGDEMWQEIVFTTTITYNGGRIGIAPRVYAPNMFMFLSIHNEATTEAKNAWKGFVSLDAQVTYDTYNIAQTQIASLVPGQSYTFRVEIKGTNYRIYLDNKILFNIEYAGMPRGKVGVYATAGNGCSNIQIESDFPDAWSSNVTMISGGIVDIQELENEDKYIFISNPTFDELYAEQSVTVVGGKAHTISFNANGLGKVRIVEANGAAPKKFEYVINSSEDWSPYFFTQTISSDCTSVYVRFVTSNEALRVNNVQLEQKSFATSYIHNDSAVSAKIRENSIVTYPAKDNIQVEQGTVSIWVRPNQKYTGTSFKPVFFEYGDANGTIRLSWDAGNFRFKHGATSVASYAGSLEKDKWYHIVGRWTNEQISITVNNVTRTLKGQHTMLGSSDIIRIGHSYYTSLNLFNGAIDETIVYSNVMTDEDVVTLYQSEEPIVNSDAMIMRATFNYAIGNFNKSIIEATLAPDYGSPVLVEKADGQPMRKVSFFDFYTGEYRTFNEELVQYDKRYEYITLSYHDKDIDQESFKINVEDADGVTYGGPYDLKGRKLYLYLTDEEKETLDGAYLYATYQLEDAYTVDFNIGVPDSFRVTLGKHDGEGVRVTYEGNGFTDEKLATMVELNPLLSPNHEGFMYITRNDEQVSSFRVRATPDDLPANGGSESLIVVEPLDTNGNYISHCELAVTCDLGTIVPTFDEESIKLRDRAGRFLYRYRSPILSLDKAGAVEVTERINVIDKETGIGVQLPITLTTLREESHKIKAGDTAEKIAERYGATVEDIALASKMTVAALRSYVPTHVNSTIKVPVNYSATQLAKAPIEIKQDMMLGYLTNRVTKYMNKPASSLPAGLGALLDFNGDGIINIREMTWLRNNRLTTVLEKKYNAVLAWDKANLTG